MFSEEEAILNSQIKELHAVLTLEDFWDPLFDMLFEFMENPILFMDGSHKITISRYSKPIYNKVWKEDLELGYHDYSTIDDSFHDVMKQLFSTRQPVFTTNDGEKCVLCTAISANSVVGFIAVLEHYRPLSENDLKLLRAAADIISAKSERYVIYQSDSNHFYGQIIQDMIEKRIKTETELANRLKTRNWKLLSCFRVIVINTEDKSHRYQRFMKNQLNIIAIGFKQLYYNDRFVLLQESEQPISKELPKDFADFILHQNLKCSVSDVFPNIFQLSIHYDQAVHMFYLTNYTI